MALPDTCTLGLITKYPAPRRPGSVTPGCQPQFTRAGRATGCSGPSQPAAGRDRWRRPVTRGGEDGRFRDATAQLLRRKILFWAGDENFSKWSLPCNWTDWKHYICLKERMALHLARKPKRRNERALTIFKERITTAIKMEGCVWEYIYEYA